MDAAQRAAYLASKRRELQRLLSDDVNVDIPIVSVPVATPTALDRSLDRPPSPMQSPPRPSPPVRARDRTPVLAPSVAAAVGKATAVAQRVASDASAVVSRRARAVAAASTAAASQPAPLKDVEEDEMAAVFQPRESVHTDSRTVAVVGSAAPRRTSDSDAFSPNMSLVDDSSPLRDSLSLSASDATLHAPPVTATVRSSADAVSRPRLQPAAGTAGGGGKDPDASVSFIITPQKAAAPTRTDELVGSASLDSPDNVSPTRLMHDIHARLLTQLDAGVLTPPRAAEASAPASSYSTPTRAGAPVATAAPDPPSATLTIPDPPEAPSLYENAKAQAIAMSVELEERTRQCAILRTQLKRAQKLMEEQAAQAKAAQTAAVDAVRTESEASTRKHLTFIDKLLADKKELTSQVAALTDTLARTSSAAEAKMKDVVDRARDELLHARDNWAAQEKARRAAWQAAQVKEIRERTIKGLEPDIERMMAQNRDEIAKIEAACQEQLAAAATRFQAEKAAAVRAAREEGAYSASDIVDREKSSWRAREAALRSEYDAEFAAMRSRLNREMDEERRRQADVGREQLTAHMADLNRVQSEWQARLDDVLRKQAAVREEAERRVAEGIATEQQRLVHEQEAWERRMTTKLRREFEEREGTLRVEMSRRKDEEMRSLMTQLDGDAQSQVVQMRAALDAELVSVRELHRTEMDSLRSHAAEAARVAADALSSRDATIASLRDEVARAVHAAQAAQDAAARAAAEVVAVQASADAERAAAARAAADAEKQRADKTSAYEAAIADLASQVRAVQGERKAVEARLTAEAAAAKRAKAEELAEVESRVKAALKKRDDLITSLRASVAEERAKAETAHRMMVAQRRDMMGESMDLSTSQGFTPSSAAPGSSAAAADA